MTRSPGRASLGRRGKGRTDGRKKRPDGAITRSTGRRLPPSGECGLLGNDVLTSAAHTVGRVRARPQMTDFLGHASHLRESGVGNSLFLKTILGDNALLLFSDHCEGGMLAGEWKGQARTRQGIAQVHLGVVGAVGNKHVED